jgi:L-lysine 6-transaminase
MRDESFRRKLADIAIHNPSNSDIYTVEMADFVETFAREAIPEHFPHLFLVAGGAVGVENALKAAFDWKVRKNLARGARGVLGQQILHFEQAFHGRTGYALSMTNTADRRKIDYFPKFSWPRIVNPKIRFPRTEENEKAVAETERKAVDQIKKALQENKDDIAALIIEPIQGEGGDNHFRKEFFQQIRALADENEFLFIVDEVQTGVGLTGRMWAYQHFDVLPDVLCFGKKTQVCGMLASRRLDEVERNVFAESARINSTWGGNLTDMVRFQRYLEIISEERLVDHARDTGDYLRAHLESLQREFPSLVTNARGRGLMCAFDLPDGATRDRFRQEAFARRMLILACGVSAIRFRPSLTVTREDVDKGMDITRECLRALAP